MQNGVDSVDLLSAALGAEHVLAGTTRINCVIGEPGEIVQNTPFSKLEMGELSGEATPRITMIADAFRATGIEVFVSDEPLREVWTKFIMIAPHASMTASTGEAVADIRSVPEGVALYRQLVEETVAVGRATGVNLAPDAVERTMDFILNLPPGAKTSMLFDYERQKRVELDYLTGTVVRRGRALGIPTPRLRRALRRAEGEGAGLWGHGVTKEGRGQRAEGRKGRTGGIDFGRPNLPSALCHQTRRQHDSTAPTPRRRPGSTAAHDRALAARGVETDSRTLRLNAWDLGLLSPDQWRPAGKPFRVLYAARCDGRGDRAGRVRGDGHRDWLPQPRAPLRHGEDD